MFRFSKAWFFGLVLTLGCGDDGGGDADGSDEGTGDDTGGETGESGDDPHDSGGDEGEDSASEGDEEGTDGDTGESDEEDSGETDEGGTEDSGDTEEDGDTGDSSDEGDSGSTGDSDGDSEDSGDSGDDTGTDTDCPYTPVDGDPEVTLEEVAGGFERPVLALGHPTQPGRMFVVQQGGSIKLVEPDEDTAPDDDFLTLDVNDGPSEAGLLGMALHPDFPDDPRFYVNYNPAEGGLRTRIEEFQLEESNPDVADPESARILLEISQPSINHNGGMVAFGPDGMLYIGMGDGGGMCDDVMSGSSRDGMNLLSKILRIDVEPNDKDPYTIPEDNPFVDEPSFAPEIYAWGFRNPWRFAFDSETDWLYVADVGQDYWEEVDVVEAGHDYGWNIMEGMHCSADTNCGGMDCDDSVGPGETNSDGMTLPIAEYRNSDRCSITGGSVYRSCEVPAWSGRYFYADFCTGEIFAVEWDGSEATELGVVYDSPQNVQGNGWNMYGDVYFTTVTNMVSNSGSVFRIAPAD